MSADPKCDEMVRKALVCATAIAEEEDRVTVPGGELPKRFPERVTRLRRQFAALFAASAVNILQSLDYQPDRKIVEELDRKRNWRIAPLWLFLAIIGLIGVLDLGGRVSLWVIQQEFAELTPEGVRIGFGLVALFWTILAVKSFVEARFADRMLAAYRELTPPAVYLERVQELMNSKEWQEYERLCNVMGPPMLTAEEFNSGCIEERLVQLATVKIEAERRHDVGGATIAESFFMSALRAFDEVGILGDITRQGVFKLAQKQLEDRLRDAADKATNGLG